MQPISRDDLTQHLDKLDVATQDDLDELLKDILVTAWPTKTAQDC